MKGSFPFSSQKFNSNVIDISATGCAVMAQVYIPKNALLNLEMEGTLFFPDDPEHVIRAVGRVCNSRNISKDTYRLGIFFENISKKDKDAIKHFVEGYDRRKEARIFFESAQNSSPPAS
jgi:c-di-GMP-binding flagellar brake protein YcgR